MLSVRIVSQATNLVISTQQMIPAVNFLIKHTDVVCNFVSFGEAGKYRSVRAFISEGRSMLSLTSGLKILLQTKSELSLPRVISPRILVSSWTLIC